MDNCKNILDIKYDITEDNYGFVDKLIRANKETIILLLLSEKPMTGYELIKQIFIWSNVFMNQGSIYAILYSFEEEGIIEIKYEKADMRTKRYYITPAGMELTQKLAKDFSDALSFIHDLISRARPSS